MMTRQLPLPVFVCGIIAAVVVALWALGSAVPTEGSAGGSLGGKPAPAIVGRTATGETFRLSDHKGKVVLLNFWATWCGPCRMETPDLVALQKEYGPRGFTVVGLSTDDFADPAALLPFAKQYAINYPVLLATPAMREPFGGIPALPTSFLINKAGNVVYAKEGLLMKRAIAARIEKLL